MALLAAQFLPGDHADDWDLDGLLHAMAAVFPVPDDVDVDALRALPREDVIEAVQGAAHDAYLDKEEGFGLDPNGVPIMRDVERQVMLMVIDSSWIHHIDALDELREGAWLSGIAQRDPLVEFKQRAFEMFQSLQATIQHDIVRFIYGVQIEVQQAPPPGPPGFAPAPRPGPNGPQPGAAPLAEPVGAAVAAGPAPLPTPTQAPVQEQHALGAREAAAGSPIAAAPAANLLGARTPASVPPPAKLPGRNDPCYCGSGLKYKKCHGR